MMPTQVPRKAQRSISHQLVNTSRMPCPTPFMACLGTLLICLPSITMSASSGSAKIPRLTTMMLRPSNR